MNLIKTGKRVVHLGMLVGSFYLGGTEGGILTRRYLENMNKDFAFYTMPTKTGPLIRTYEGVGGTEWRLYDPESGKSRIIRNNMTVHTLDAYKGLDIANEWIDWGTNKSKEIQEHLGDGLETLGDGIRERWKKFRDKDD